MTGYSLASVAALTLACLVMGGCRQQMPSDETNNAAHANEADPRADVVAAMENATQPIEVKSIIRPTIVDQPAKAPPLEPLAVTIGFGSAGLALDQPAREQLDKLVAEPVAKAGGPITLRGHSDSRGSDGDNLVASRLRAEAVRDYLVEKGVDKKRMTVISLGEMRPVAPNAHEDGSDDPEGRARNRRVEVTIDLPEPAEPAAAGQPTPDSAPEAG